MGWGGGEYDPWIFLEKDMIKTTCTWTEKVKKKEKEE
jgi:hypothetical protein